MNLGRVQANHLLQILYPEFHSLYTTHWLTVSMPGHMFLQIFKDISIINTQYYFLR